MNLGDIIRRQQALLSDDPDRPLSNRALARRTARDPDAADPKAEVDHTTIGYWKRGDYAKARPGLLRTLAMAAATRDHLPDDLFKEMMAAVGRTDIAPGQAQASLADEGWWVALSPSDRRLVRQIGQRLARRVDPVKLNGAAHEDDQLDQVDEQSNG